MMSESKRRCPSCGETFDGNAPLHAHHKRTHGEPLRLERLETAKCIGCEQQFDYDPKRRDGDVCMECSKQYPGHANSHVIPRLLKQMNPEELREQHDDAVRQWWKNNE